MTHVRSFLINFLLVFFINRVAPGIQVIYLYQVPDIGSDIVFSLVVGFLNAAVFPFFSLMDMKISAWRIAIPTFVISYGAFAWIWLIPFGVKVTAPAGFYAGGTIVWIVAFFSNYLEWKHDQPTVPKS